MTKHHAPFRFVAALLGVAATLALGAVTNTITAQTFTGLGFPAGASSSAARAVSADGSVVVGDSGTPFAGTGFRWTSAGGMQSLGTFPSGTYTFAPAVSGDGTVVAGYGDTPAGQRGYRWTSATGLVDIGGLPGATQVLASGASTDGSVLVTTVNAPVGYRACRWTAAGGTVSLGTLPGGAISFGYGCNADGSVVVGDSYSIVGGQFFDVAFRWTSAGGMQSLGAFPGGTFSFAYAVSADGLVVVGDSDGPLGDIAYRWTAAGGMQSLGVLPVAFNYMVSNGVNADGSVIVGSTDTGTPFLWTAALGIQDLNLFLPSLGINLAGWTLTDAGGVSADGNVIVGTGLHNGVEEAWIASLGLATYVTFGQGCAGSGGVPALVAHGVPSLGSQFTVDVVQLPPTGGIAVMLLGFSNTQWNGVPLPLALAGIGLPGCDALCSVDLLTALLHTNGTATQTLTIPPVPAFAGVHFYQQALSLDAAAGNGFGGALSNGGDGTLR